TIAVVALAVPEVFGVSTNNRRTFSTTEKSFLVLQRERSFPLKSIGQARATRKMLDQLEKSSSPKQRLFVGPLDLRRTNYNDTFIYHLMLQLRRATSFQPIDPVHVSPPISVGRIGSFSTGVSHVWNEPNASSEFGAD